MLPTYLTMVWFKLFFTDFTGTHSPYPATCAASMFIIIDSEVFVSKRSTDSDCQPISLIVKSTALHCQFNGIL